MPTKTGMGGHAKEAYDPATGKFIEDGKANVRHPNPNEAQKIAGGVSPQKIQRESANTMSAPTPNLGKYAEPKKKIETERSDTLRNEYGIEPADKLFDSTVSLIKDGKADDFLQTLVDMTPDTSLEEVKQIAQEEPEKIARILIEEFS